MMDCGCVGPNLCLGGSDNHQLVMGNSGHIVTYCLILKGSVSTKDQKPAKSCFSKGEWLSTKDGRALLQNPKDVHFNSPVGACQRLQIASPPASDTSRTIDSDGSYGSIDRAACTALDLLQSLLLF